MLSVNFDPFPELYTARLVLRRVRKSDVADLFRLRSDKRVMQYIGRPITLHLDDVIQLIDVIDDLLAKNNGITWAISLKEKDQLLGTIGLWRIVREHYRAEIGYLLDPLLQGKGIMQEAMEAVLDYGFKNIMLHSVEAHVNPGNEASIKLLERNHFIREAHFKENYFFNGKFLDSYIYSLITPYQSITK
ncbi:MAG TPA: GNAT family protein [Puia sp.]|nr:GNAT family protein [Puia sp.]